MSVVLWVQGARLRSRLIVLWLTRSAWPIFVIDQPSPLRVGQKPSLLTNYPSLLGCLSAGRRSRCLSARLSRGVPAACGPPAAKVPGGSGLGREGRPRRRDIIIGAASDSAVPQGILPVYPAETLSFLLKFAVACRALYARRLTLRGHCVRGASTARYLPR